MPVGEHPALVLHLRTRFTGSCPPITSAARLLPGLASLCFGKLVH